MNASEYPILQNMGNQNHSIYYYNTNLYVALEINTLRLAIITRAQRTRHIRHINECIRIRNTTNMGKQNHVIYI